MKNKEPYVYDPDSPLEKIADFCEHVIGGFLIGLLIGAALAFFWIVGIQP